jgi:hypothetical protein
MLNNNKNLISAFNTLKKALKANDVKQLDELISNDYLGFSLHGTIETKQDILNNFVPNGVVLTEYAVDDINYEQINNIGIITGKGSIAGTFQQSEFRHKVVFTDIFKYSDDAWKYFKSQVTEIRSALP